MKIVLLNTIVLTIILYQGLPVYGGNNNVQYTIFSPKLYIGQVQKCAEKFMELSLVKYRAQNIGKVTTEYRIANTVEVLQDYQFSCSSSITSILLGIKIRTKKGSRNQFPRVQVYRPNGNNYQYKRVGSSIRHIYYSTSNYSTNGVFEYPLRPPIAVRRGDLLAISQPPASESVISVFSVNGVFLSQNKLCKKNLHLSNTPRTDRMILAYPIATGLNYVQCCMNCKIVSVYRSTLLQ